MSSTLKDFQETGYDIYPLIELQDICNELIKTSHVATKQAILKCYAKHTLWLETLQYLLNPANKSGISTVKIHKEVFPSGVSVPTTLQELYRYLGENNTGRDRDIEVVQKFIYQQHDEFHDFLHALLTKTLRRGVDISTVNSVYGSDFIPVVSVMLAQNLFDKVGNVDRLVEQHIDGRSFSITLKLDGFRCLAIKHNDKVTLLSRNGKQIEGLTEIERDLLSHPLQDFVLDGELLLDNWEYMVTPNTDAYKDVSKVVRKKGEKTGVHLWAFDIVGYDVFKNQGNGLPYKVRREILNRNFDSTLYHTIKVLPQIASTVSNLITVGDWLQRVMDAKQEGLMLNLNDASYSFGRTRDLLKVKLMNDVDLTVIGAEEGTGRLEGTLGALICEYKGNTVKVGSGFDDLHRRQIWANLNTTVGKTVCVQYFEETEDAQGNKSLRFPVFLKFVEHK